MARKRKPKARREAARNNKQYILEHQREIAAELQRKYLLAQNPEASNQIIIKSEERQSRAYGLRAMFGVMMNRVFQFASSPIPEEDVKFFRFESGLDCTDNYGEMLLRWHQAKLLEAK